MIEVQIQGEQAIIADFRDAPERITRAAVRALNRGIASAKTVMVRLIAADTGLKVSDVRDAIPLHEATFSRPAARIAASLKRIPLIKFGARGTEPSRGKGRGVSYRLKGGAGRLPKAFIATMPTGHRGVFMRVGTRRLPIKERFGPSLGHVFKTHRAAGVARAMEMFTKNFDHELKFRQAGDAGAA